MFIGMYLQSLRIMYNALLYLLYSLLQQVYYWLEMEWDTWEFLFAEFMAWMFHYAVRTQMLLIGLTIELQWVLIVSGAHL